MSEEKVFDLMEAANELTSEDAGTDSVSTEVSEVEGQSLANPEETTEELDPREILNKVSQEQSNPEAFKQTLEQINALGAIHNGLPVKIDSQEQLKEIIQKGFDYTKKTMSHAEEVKAKTEEFAKIEASFKEKEQALAQKEQEIESVVNDNNIITSLLTKWQTQDPELFAHIQNAYIAEMNQYKMHQPALAKYDGEFKKLQEEIKQLKGGKQAEELASIRQGWEKGLGDVQARTAGSLSKLGVKIDWEKVKNVWSADATGKMEVEDALYAAYGKEIAKANQSYQKLLATKTKASTANLKRTGVGLGSGGQKGDMVFKAGDYESILRESI
jgi:cell fate (sporulation/competence/biofilm development) regulator YlbF (YheA/YmcA/DUF963 family)